MTGTQRATTRPYTLVLCTACASPVGSAVLDQLRATVRRSRHGMLVTTECLLGAFTCAARRDRGGAVLMLQPCSPQRVANGPATWLRAVDHPGDLATICAWIERGRWEHDDFPDHLRLTLPAARRAIAAN